MSGLRLGLFSLQETIGQGGLGSVWLGEHITQGTPVAVKVITQSIARDPRVLKLFQREARAMASLEYPGIVSILDYGMVHAQAEAMTNGALVARSPFLVMELAAGTLDDLTDHLDWERNAEVFLDVLGALAHAHAHGVIHRDLKPENVLIFMQDGRWKLKLTDFGLAHAVDGLSSTEAKGRTAGTPPYMAPEQFLGYWRDYGPWTDLYAFGCMAWELLTGHVPFRAPSLPELVNKHLNEPPPDFEPRVPVPPAVEPWLRRLLHKDPAERYQMAADAAWALCAIIGRPERFDAPSPGIVLETEAETSGPPSQTDELEEEGEATQVMATAEPGGVAEGTQMLSAEELSAAAARDRGDGSARLKTAADLAGERPSGAEHTPYQNREGGAGVARKDPPPLPEGWAPAELPRDLQLLGAGLGLFGLKPVPMVDRVPARDAIWDALRAVHATRRPRAVVLRGPLGTGKSRLAQWMAERAREVGGAHLLRATHSTRSSIYDGLPMMLARQIRCAGLRREPMKKRVLKVFERQPKAMDEIEATVLTELLMGAGNWEGEQGATRWQFSSASERYAVVERYLERLGSERPLILWLDDVQWGADAIQFALHLLGAPDQLGLTLPVLVILTARDDLLQTRPLETRLLHDLGERDDVTSLTVGGLTDDDQRELVQRLLGLDEGLTEQVVQRTQGNPLFAVQLVGDWVKRGILIVTREGFRLKEGATAPIPDDLHGLWRGRVTRLQAELEEAGVQDALPLLELAAALGREVDIESWRQIARQSRLTLSDDLVDALLDAGLATLSEDGSRIQFTHGMLVESLMRIAEEAGRWEQHQRACVQSFYHLYQARIPGYAERIAYHLMEAGDEGEALEPLLIAAQEALSESDFDYARSLLGQREELMERLNLPQTDPRWAEGWMCDAGIGITAGDLDFAEQALSYAERVAFSMASPALQAELLRMRGMIAQKRGDATTAVACLQQAIEGYHRLGARAGIADCLNGLGAVFQLRGELQKAAEHFEHGIELFQQEEDDEGVAMCLNGLGETCRLLGDGDRARELFQRAMSYFERSGNRVGAASCLNNIGEVARFSGDLDEAETFYREAIERLTQLGAQDMSEPRNNLALVLLAREQYEDARELLLKVRDALSQSERAGYVGVVMAELCVCDAARGDIDAFDEHHFEADRLLGENGMVEQDVAWAAGVAGELWMEHGDAHRARRAFQMALEQWRALERFAEAQHVQQALAALG